MIEPLKRPEQYRQRAAECRSLAGRASDPSIREEYENLAAHYEAIADAAEKLEEIERRMKKGN
jgi:hypothetical protein